MPKKRIAASITGAGGGNDDEDNDRGGHRSKKVKLSPAAQLHAAQKAIPAKQIRVAMFGSDDSSDESVAESENDSELASQGAADHVANAAMVESVSSVSVAAVSYATGATSANVAGPDTPDSFPFWNSDGPASPDVTVDELEEIELPRHTLARTKPCPDPAYHISAPFRMYHRSWGHFLLYKLEWEEANNVKTYIKYTDNVARRNAAQQKKMPAYEASLHDYRQESQLLLASGKDGRQARRPKRPEVIPDYCLTWKRTILCTHGGTRKSRGTGARPLQEIRSTGCPFKFVAEVQDWNGFWVIVVKAGSFFHNHPVNQFVFDGYSQNRTLTPHEDIRHELATMIRGQGKTTEMFDYLIESYDKPFRMKDIHNYIAEYKKERDGDVPDNVRVTDFLVLFHEEATGNAASVSTRANGVTGTISMTSRFMRQLTERFPEVLMIDCTHGVTSNNYQLCSLVVMDESGLGQFVQHTLMETNSTWHLEQVVLHFKATSPCWHKIRVVVLDKDFKEIDVIKRLLPNVRIILCTFHVLKYLKNEIRKEKYGRRSLDEVAELYELVYKMVYTTEEEAYTALLASFKATVGKYKGPPAKKDLWVYFETNWANCSEMWATHMRLDLPHLDNNTNNRLESNFGKLKDEMPDHQTALQCLKYLRKRANRDAHKYKVRVSFVGTRVHYAYDDEMDAVLRCCTPWVAAQIKKEYDLATQLKSRYVITDVNESHALVRLKSSCEIDKTTWCGTCGFAATMKLPCRHAIGYRLVMGLSPEIPTFAVDRRWSVEAPSMDESLDASVATYRHTKEAKPTTAPLNRNERYRLIHPILTEISDVLVAMGTTRVRREAQRLKTYLQSLHGGQPSLISAAVCAEEKGRSKIASDDAVVDGEAPGDNNSDDDEDQLKQEPGNQDEEDQVKQEPASHDPDGDDEEEEDQVKQEPASHVQAEEADDHLKQEALTKQFAVNMRVAAPKVGRPSSGPLNLRPRSQSRKSEDDSDLDEVLAAAAAATDLARAILELEKIPVKKVPTSARSPAKRFQFVADVREKMLSYVVPVKLIAVCKSVIAEKEREDGGVALESSQDTRTPGVAVPGVGMFTRNQIFAMQDYFAVLADVTTGLETVQWLRDVADATYDSVAERLQTLRPDSLVPGCELAEIHVRSLYRARGQVWFGEGLIHAFGIALHHRYQNNTIIMGAKLSWKDSVKTLGKMVLQNAVIYSDPFALLPVNVSDNHWACLAVDRTQRLVVAYDSRGKPRTKTLLSSAATELCDLLSEDGGRKFELQIRKAPLQEDDNNCGLFVYMFMQSVVSMAPEFTCPPEEIGFQRAEILDQILGINSKQRT